jgi:four helix bundle protein
LNKNSIGSNISKQLLRAGTSAGANYEEACGAEGRADFIHKMQIILKELRESMYWLRLIQKSKILKFRNFRNILNDADQLCCIIAKSVITAKNNQKI